MKVTIYQINGRVEYLPNVTVIMDDEERNVFNIWLDDNSFHSFNKDLIALIKIGGQHEYKKR